MLSVCAPPRWSPGAAVVPDARLGFDRRFGARPLQRTLEQHVAGPLARFLVDHAGLTDGALKLHLDADGGVVVDLA